MPYKIVFFDIDGTLVNEEKKIPPDTKVAIEKLKDRNIKVAIATESSCSHRREV
ncbi:HAD hydrolase family protein [Effusibacillus consociatus]|uniref:HAD hydrolase family protein n=1 Tax=Effusibacillus consociatus TaxID=1117041 RepID=A0ABV9PZ54_9BACL